MESLLEQQRKEAEQIALSLFRFKARRSVGVYYALLSSLFPTAVILSDLLHSSYEVLAGLIVAAFALWCVSRAAGFQGLSKMAYSIDLLNGKTKARKGRFQLHTRFDPVQFLILSWPWIVFLLAEVQGLSYIAIISALVWIAELVPYRILSYARAKQSILEYRSEDWAVLASLVLAPICSIVLGIGLLSFVPASIVWLFAGIKSLYDAPKELASEYE